MHHTDGCAVLSTFHRTQVQLGKTIPHTRFYDPSAVSLVTDLSIYL
jgi:hypothetical protein